MSKKTYSPNEIQFGRPKEYDTNEPRKNRSIRLTDLQVQRIKVYYKTMQDFIEDAYEIIIEKNGSV